MYSTRKDILEIIKENTLYPVGEYLVIPKDALIRFMTMPSQSLMDEEYRLLSEIIDAILSLFPKVARKEDLELKIPSSHRYTKFNYVVDAQSIYIPYHYHISELYGIYLRGKFIKEDFPKFIEFAIALLKDERFYERLRVPSFDSSLIKSLLSHKTIVYNILAAIYIEAIYYHSLAHHVIEDISYFYEQYGIDKYSIIRSADEEESFCEAVMYKALKAEYGWNAGTGGFALDILYKLRDLSIFPPISTEDTAKFLKIFRSVFPQLLYVYRSKDFYKRYPMFKPKISQEVSEKLSFLFTGFWYSHVSNIEVIKVSRGDQEIFSRIFVIED